MWNSLPEEVVTAEFVNCFKERFDRWNIDIKSKLEPDNLRQDRSTLQASCIHESEDDDDKSLINTALSFADVKVWCQLPCGVVTSIFIFADCGDENIASTSICNSNSKQKHLYDIGFKLEALAYHKTYIKRLVAISLL
jgi:hypothetical protein